MTTARPLHSQAPPRVTPPTGSQRDGAAAPQPSPLHPAFGHPDLQLRFCIPHSQREAHGGRPCPAVALPVLGEHKGLDGFCIYTHRHSVRTLHSVWAASHTLPPCTLHALPACPACPSPPEALGLSLFLPLPVLPSFPTGPFSRSLSWVSVMAPPAHPHRHGRTGKGP